MNSLITKSGSPDPLGATVDQNGVNFSILAPDATSVRLLLFRGARDLTPFQTIDVTNTTLYYWHVYVCGLTPGSFYAFRIDGPSTPQDLSSFGHRFDPQKVLLDPYSRGNVDDLWKVQNACGPGDDVATSIRCAIIDDSGYDWEGDAAPNRPRRDSVIYELHVRGFTQSPNSNCLKPGTFAGLIEKLSYIKSLGVTAVELMPVFDFDDKSPIRNSPVTGAVLRDYWGYNPFSFFAPQNGFCCSPDRATHQREFRDMVKALHAAGIEVILDVVFNHTSEGNQNGPVINFKGIGNRTYYFLNKQNNALYIDFTGCGNTVKCNHPVTTKLIEECLHFWVTQMHVDGFRFDLGSILALDENGDPLEFPPVVWAIDLDDALSKIKVIAEPYGAGQDLLGSFPGVRWATWNWQYKNVIRRFVRGDRGLIGAVASRIAGSSDLFAASGHKPVNSINYITCHDGFTLRDLVSYNYKHNEANGEDSGDNDNLSFNCGTEGETRDPAILSLRLRQRKNFFTVLLLSQGVPMILAGDECGRTQQGNNNPYLQDNAISWFDWTGTATDAELLRFLQAVVAFRLRHDALRSEEFLQGHPSSRGLKDVAWHGCQLDSPGWFDPNSGVLSFTLADPGNGEDIHAILNMETSPLAFQIPPVDGRRWYRSIDTSLPQGTDIMAAGAEVLIMTGTYVANGRSVVVLVSK